MRDRKDSIENVDAGTARDQVRRESEGRKKIRNQGSREWRDEREGWRG